MRRSNKLTDIRTMEINGASKDMLDWVAVRGYSEYHAINVETLVNYMINCNKMDYMRWLINFSRIIDLTIYYNPAINVIPLKAFTWCNHIESIKLPMSVKTIGNYAFYMCSDLRNVVIPDSIEYIGYDVFRGCKSLKSIYIPSSVLFIGSIRHDTEVVCDEGSSAELYCKNNNHRYYMLGDDGDLIEPKISG